MSDVSQGPGWWLASDGKWYPPQPPAEPAAAPAASQPEKLVVSFDDEDEPATMPAAPVSPAAEPVAAVPPAAAPPAAPIAATEAAAASAMAAPPPAEPAAAAPPATPAASAPPPVDSAIDSPPPFAAPAAAAPTVAETAAQPAVAGTPVETPATEAGPAVVGVPVPPMNAGWWRASDGMWYPPETHPDYSAAPATPTAATVAPTAAAVAPTAAAAYAPPQPMSAPTGQYPPQPQPAYQAGPPPWTSGPRSRGWSSPPALRFLGVGAAVLAIVGVFTPWVSIEGLSLKGWDATPDGRIMFGIALGTAVLALIHAIAPSKFASIIVFLGFGAIVGQSVYEFSGILSTQGFKVSWIGVGLYLCAAGGVIGVVLSLIDASKGWAEGGAIPAWIPIVGLIVLLAGAGGAGWYGNHEATADTGGQSVDFGNSGSGLGTGGLNFGTSGSSRTNSGSSGNNGLPSPTYITGTGDTGDTGSGFFGGGDSGSTGGDFGGGGSFGDSGGT